jgi:GMP synthase (glutamine-hydrolysing)
MTASNLHAHSILILDYGSQYTQLIARRVREVGVYCEIYPWDSQQAQSALSQARGIILSGGPESTTCDDTPDIPDYVLQADVPVLGICYGMQALIKKLGGEVSESSQREFGFAQIKVNQDSVLLNGLNDELDVDGQSLLNVWMSHGDKVTSIPSGFECIASTPSAEFAVVADEQKQLYGLQFHPEVTHTQQGREILKGFLFNICACKGDWTSGNIIEDQIQQVQAQVKDEHVILGLSGGVDSSVVAALLHKAIGEQLIPVCYVCMKVIRLCRHSVNIWALK